MSGSFDIHGIFSNTDQGAIVTADIAEVRNVAPSGGSLIQEEPGDYIESDVSVEDDEKDWFLVGITMPEEVEACRLGDKIRALQKKVCFASGEVPADILIVVALGEQSLHINHQVTMYIENVLVEVERKLMVESRASLPA